MLFIVRIICPPDLIRLAQYASALLSRRPVRPRSQIRPGSETDVAAQPEYEAVINFHPGALRPLDVRGELQPPQNRSVVVELDALGRTLQEVGQEGPRFLQIVVEIAQTQGVVVTTREHAASGNADGSGEGYWVGLLVS